MRAQEHELEGLVVAPAAIRAGHELIVSLFSAGPTVEVDDEALLDRAGVEPPEVLLDRLAHSQRLLHDHPDLVLHLLFNPGVLAKRLHEAFSKSVSISRRRPRQRCTTRLCHREAWPEPHDACLPIWCSGPCALSGFDGSWQIGRWLGVKATGELKTVKYFAGIFALHIP